MEELNFTVTEELIGEYPSYLGALTGTGTYPNDLGPYLGCV